MDGRNVRVEEDGTVVYRASALGSDCTRSLVLSRLDYEEKPPPADMLLRFNEGHLHEGDVLARMRAEGWTIWDEQAEVSLMVTGKIRVVGHIDGKGAMAMAEGGPELIHPRVVEVKSQSMAEFEAFGARGWDSGIFPKYKWQLSCYMHATGLPAVLVRKNRNNGQLAVEWIDEPFYSLRDIRSRVLSIELLAMDGIGPADCDGKQYPCPFFYLPGHDAAAVEKRQSKGVVPVPRRVLAGEEARRVDDLARRHEIAKDNEKSAKAAKDAARKQLVEAGAGAAGLDLDTGTRVTFWSQRQGPRRLSKDAEDGLRAFLLWWFGYDIDNHREQGVGDRMSIKFNDEGQGTGDGT